MGRTALKTFYIMQILLERTDEEHSLNATQIGSILKAEYGISVDRHTLYSEIDKLCDVGLDIIKLEGKTNGYYVASRRFELPELKLLVDAVQSSLFITKKKSEKLIKKLETLCSREEAKQLSSQVVVYSRPKTDNETIYYNVDMLHSAIYHNRQIRFQYAEWTVQKKQVFRHDGAFYQISPIHLIWDDENYYLVGFDEKEQKTKHFRVDKMRGMEISDEARSEDALKERADLGGFSKKTFGMFGGKDCEVTLRCENALAGVIIDRFGKDVRMLPDGKDFFKVHMTVCVSRQFFGWMTGIGPGLEITDPEEVRKEYQNYLREILRKY